jgi:hypothetical protein
VVVLPRRSASEAADVLRRVQEELLVAINQANLPPFTASYGVTDSHQAGTLEELLRVADAILGKQARLQNPGKEDVLPREVIGLAVPGRPSRSLVAEGRSAGGVRDQTGPAGLTHAIPW